MSTTEGDRRACDYELSVEDAEYLQAVALLPFEERGGLLIRYCDEHGSVALANLFAQFVGMANSVVANNRECVEMLGWMNGEMRPEQANLPTIFGALHGVTVAAPVRQEKTCDGCAFRLGSPANQSPTTTADVMWCAAGGDDFMCHERGLDEHGNPTRRCVGYAQIAPATR